MKDEYYKSQFEGNLKKIENRMENYQRNNKM